MKEDAAARRERTAIVHVNPYVCLAKLNGSAFAAVTAIGGNNV